MAHRRERVLVRHAASSRVVDPTVEALVDQVWSDQLAEAAADRGAAAHVLACRPSHCARNQTWPIPSSDR